MVIQVAELRVSLGQIIRTEFTDDASAIVQVRIGEDVYTRGLCNHALVTFLADVSRVALCATKTAAPGGPPAAAASPATGQTEPSRD